MKEPTHIGPARQLRRPHHISDWADRRNLRQADIAAEIGADKSLVSRWFKGATPSEHWQEKLANLFSCDRASLFQHPDEDWLKRFFQGLTTDEIDRAKRILEAAFPRAGRDD